jgi:hypothetical protein
LLYLLLGGAVAVLALVIYSRMNEVFCVSIRNGRCLVVRGHVPPSVWRELREVVGRAKIARGTVRVVREGGRPRLVTSGLDEGTTQRLRNAFGAQGYGKAAHGANVPCASAATATGARRNWGQLLGIAWLAWLLSGR